MQRKFGDKTHQHTVKHFLARFALPVQLARNLRAFAKCADAYQARWPVVRLWYEGWPKQRIASCLPLARAHVSAIMAAFARDGVEGRAAPRTRPVPHPDDQLPRPLLKEV